MESAAGDVARGPPGGDQKQTHRRSISGDFVMLYVLKVTLEPYGTGFAVGVDETKKANEIKRGKHKISWRLRGNAYQGSFVSLEWLTPKPAAGVFDPDPPQKTPAGKHLNTEDTNSATKDYRYKLTIEVDGTQYSTRVSTSSSAATSGGATITTVTNPIIKNK